MTHVLVVTPCGETIKSQTAQCIVDLMMKHAHPRTASYGVAEGTNPGPHNTAVRTLQENKVFTHLLFLDSDQTFPPDTLTRLLKRDRDIVGSTYRARHYPHSHFFFPIDILGENPTAGALLGVDPGKRTGLVPVAAVPCGTMLIKRKVLDGLDYPWFWISEGFAPGLNQSNDVNFCFKARSKGFRVYCDLDLSRDVGHFGNIEMGYDKPPPAPKEDKLI